MRGKPFFGSDHVPDAIGTLKNMISEFSTKWFFFLQPSYMYVILLRPRQKNKTFILGGASGKKAFVGFRSHPGCDRNTKKLSRSPQYDWNFIKLKGVLGLDGGILKAIWIKEIISTVFMRGKKLFYGALHGKSDFLVPIVSGTHLNTIKLYRSPPYDQNSKRLMGILGLGGITVMKYKYFQKCFPLMA